MGRKDYTTEQIVDKLRQVEVETAKGVTIGEACRNFGISEHSYYKWQREYAGCEPIKLNVSKNLNVRMFD